MKKLMMVAIVAFGMMFSAQAKAVYVNPHFVWNTVGLGALYLFTETASQAKEYQKFLTVSHASAPSYNIEIQQSQYDANPGGFIKR